MSCSWPDLACIAESAGDRGERADTPLVAGTEACISSVRAVQHPDLSTFGHLA